MAGQVNWNMITGIIIGFILAVFIIAAIYFFSRKKQHLSREDDKTSGKIEVSLTSGIGAREEQQDAFCITNVAAYHEHGILVCLADGMGGHEFGEEVSKTAVAGAVNAFKGNGYDSGDKILISALKSANAAVNAFLSSKKTSGGTTFLLGYLADDVLYYCAVGDSRIYLLRDGSLFTLTRSHIYAEELFRDRVNGRLGIGKSEEDSNADALTSYIGMGNLKYIDIPDQPLCLKKGDKIAFMSDGVFRTLDDAEIQNILEKETDYGEAIERAILVKSRKYQDNYTALILTVR